MANIKTFCTLPFKKLIIDEFGFATSCCHQNKPLGNVFQQDLMSLWNSKMAKDIRLESSAKNLHTVCSTSKTCPFINHPRTLSEHEFRAYPHHIEICLPSSHCNIGGENPNAKNPACIMCIRNFDLIKHKPMTDEICASIKPFVQYLDEFTVLGIAEPFWKGEAWRVFDMIDFHKYRNQIKFSTNTNGICLTDKVTDEFFNRINSSEMSFSIDAATPETFIKIRRMDTYDLIVKNMKNFMAKREEFGGAKKHVVKIYNNINLINVHEMGLMIEMCKEVGADEILLVPTHNQMGRVNLGEIIMNESNLKLFQRYANIAKVRAIELDVKLTFGNSFYMLPESDLIQIGIKK